MWRCLASRPLRRGLELLQNHPRPGTRLVTRGNTHIPAVNEKGELWSPYPDIELPVISVTEYCFRDAHKHGAHPALVNGETDQIYTFDQTKDAIWRISSALTRHGFRKGDVLMIVSPNVPEYILMFHAVACLGGAFTMANHGNPIAELIRHARDSSPTFLCVDQSMAAHGKQIAEALGTIKKTYVFGQSEGLHPVSALLEDDGSASLMGQVDIDPAKDVCLLPYSSGTTGLPKGVMLTHYGIVTNVIQIDNRDIFAEREGAKLLAYLPFFHVFGILTNYIMGLAWGQTSVTMRNFEPGAFLRNIQKHQISMMFAVPPIIVFMGKDPSVANHDLSSVKRIVAGAAPLGTETAAEFSQKVPGAIVGQAYGMTESGPAICLNPIQHCRSKPGAVGFPLANSRVKFVDPETGRVCGPHERGELWAHGPQMLKGYLNNPEATAQLVDTDGWLHTGDLGYYDDDGHMFIADRVKELIKYKGFQVPPAELENLILQHPAVKDVGVTGFPDDMAGELPRAYVVLKPDQSATQEDIADFVASHVTSQKKLRGGVVFVSEIPKLASGKILRRVLREMDRKEVEGAKG